MGHLEGFLEYARKEVGENPFLTSKYAMMPLKSVTMLVMASL